MKPRLRLARVAPLAAVAAAAAFASPAHAQELSVYSGALAPDNGLPWVRAWGFGYRHALDPHSAVSFEWLNEGSVKDNHRDGLAFQYWWRMPLLERRLSIDAGIGPYAFFNTTSNGQRDDHGWAALMSVAATWYASHRLFYQLRLNQVVAARSFDSTSLMFGIGYQLDAPRGRGPLTGGTSDSVPSGDELTALAGQSTVNNRGTPDSFAWAIEYRHGLTRYFDATLSWIDEGSTNLSERRGVAAQLWLRRSFVADRLSVGIGAGPYYALERRTPGGDGSPVALLFTMSAAYNVSRHWSARLEWHRVMTTYDKDSDVMLAGVGYRF